MRPVRKVIAEWGDEPRKTQLNLNEKELGGGGGINERTEIKEFFYE
jgi:hypothetical protein